MFENIKSINKDVKKNINNGFNKGFNRVVNNLMYTETGSIFLSIILGLGVASLFRKFCNGKNCYNFIAPEQKNIKDQIYSFDSANKNCYIMREKNIKCGSKEKTVDFA